MTAAEIRRKATENRERIDDYAAAADKLRRETEAKQRIESVTYDIAELKKEAKKEIEKAVEEGEFEVTLSSDYYGTSYQEVYDTVAGYYRKKGFTATVESRWHDSDSGDRDSGEGARDAGRDYSITISWEKE